MLRVEGLTVGYGGGVVLRVVSFTARPAAVTVLSGFNGTGKTTLLHAIAGLLPAREGAVLLGSVALHRLPAHRVARAGVALVPQGRRIFGSLTVDEHLALAARPGPWSTGRVLEALPALGRLRRRIGKRLSGGEQQLLAIGRALVANPTLLLLDEPTEGIAPDLVPVVTGVMERVAADGGTVLVTAAQTVRTDDSGGGGPLAGTRLSIREL